METRYQLPKLIAEKEMLTESIFMHSYVASTTYVGANVATFSSLEGRKVT